MITAEDVEGKGSMTHSNRLRSITHISRQARKFGLATPGQSYDMLNI